MRTRSCYPMLGTVVALLVASTDLAALDEAMHPQSHAQEDRYAANPTPAPCCSFDPLPKTLLSQTPRQGLRKALATPMKEWPRTAVTRPVGRAMRFSDAADAETGFAVESSSGGPPFGVFTIGGLVAGAGMGYVWCELDKDEEDREDENRIGAIGWAQSCSGAAAEGAVLVGVIGLIVDLAIYLNVRPDELLPESASLVFGQHHRGGLQVGLRVPIPRAG